MSLFRDMNPDCTHEILLLLDKASLRALAQVSKTAYTLSLPLLARSVVLYLQCLNDERIVNNFCNAVQKYSLYSHIRTLGLKIAGDDLPPPSSLRRLFSQLRNLECISMELEPSIALRLDLSYFEYGRQFASAEYGELLHSLFLHNAPSQITLHNILLSTTRASGTEYIAGVGIRYLSLRSPHIAFCDYHAEGVERLLLAAGPTVEALQLTGTFFPGFEAIRSEGALEYPKVKTLYIDALPITLSVLADSFPKLRCLFIPSDYTTTEHFNPSMWLGSGGSAPVEFPELVALTGPCTLVDGLLRQSHAVNLRRLCLPAQYDDEMFHNIHDLYGFLDTICLTPVTSLTITIESSRMPTLHLALERLVSALPNLNFLGIRLCCSLRFDGALKQVSTPSTPILLSTGDNEFCA